jgi:glycosyltransferase involved in cell wall biosynthesis
MKKCRLAVISTYDDFCGISAYTKYIKPRLDMYFDVTVFNLDQYLLRKANNSVVKLGDRHIREICGALSAFDAVNLQLEFGTLGRDAHDILRRLRWIIDAAPAISVTFHTVLEPRPLNWGSLLQMAARLQFVKLLNEVRAYLGANRMVSKPFQILRESQRRKPTSIIVHTMLAKRYMHHINRLQHVYDHPLAFIAPDGVAAFKDASRSEFPLLSQISPDAKLIGVFGFLGPYKGFETAIRALHLLPPEYHLLVFGSVHPQTIRNEQKIDPYVRTLLDEAYVGTSIIEQFASSSVKLSVHLDASLASVLARHPKDLSDRIHFMGALPDKEFARGMAICDSVVFPYLEVGQSSSGPISQAIELGSRVIASRTLAYLQLARYHSNVIEFFDIGNHLELAQRLQAPPAYPPEKRLIRYNADTNMQVYCAANGVPVDSI